MPAFRAPFLNKESIWEAVERFRADYKRAQIEPVDVLDLVELDLKLELIPTPRLKETTDIEAILTGDRTGIWVDARVFEQPRYENRLRFSVAHEIGHYVLHDDLYKTAQYSTVEEWKEFIGSIPEREYSHIEFHAYEFAGRLLVPVEALREELQNQLNLIPSQSPAFSDDQIAAFISSPIGKRFNVSADVIQRRFRSEEISTNLP